MEAIIIADMALGTLPHLKSQKSNLQNITRETFEPSKINWWHLCYIQSCPNVGSGLLNKMVELCSVRAFLGLFKSHAS